MIPKALKGLSESRKANVQFILTALATFAFLRGMITAEHWLAFVGGTASFWQMAHSNEEAAKAKAAVPVPGFSVEALAANKIKPRQVGVVAVEDPK